MSYGGKLTMARKGKNVPVSLDVLRKLPPEGKNVNIPLQVEREGLTERRKSLYFIARVAKSRRRGCAMLAFSFVFLAFPAIRQFFIQRAALVNTRTA